MKKILYILIIITAITVSSFLNFMLGQSIDNRLHNILKLDLGISGTWINIEYPISKNIALLTEIGVNPLIFSRVGDPIGVLFSGRIKQGVRLYYDREFRFNEEIVIDNNTGNFFTFIIDYQPPFFSWSSDSSKMILREVRIIPSWGLRRSIGRRFIIEGHLGFGYGYTINNIPKEQHNIVYDIKIAVGYVLWDK